MARPHFLKAPWLVIALGSLVSCSEQTTSARPAQVSLHRSHEVELNPSSLEILSGSKITLEALLIERLEQADQEPLETIVEGPLVWNLNDGRAGSVQIETDSSSRATLISSFATGAFELQITSQVSPEATASSPFRVVPLKHTLHHRVFLEGDDRVSLAGDIAIGGSHKVESGFLFLATVRSIEGSHILENQVARYSLSDLDESPVVARFQFCTDAPEGSLHQSVRLCANPNGDAYWLSATYHNYACRDREVRRMKATVDPLNPIIDRLDFDQLSHDLELCLDSDIACDSRGTLFVLARSIAMERESLVAIHHPFEETRPPPSRSFFKTEDQPTVPLASPSTRRIGSG